MPFAAVRTHTSRATAEAAALGRDADSIAGRTAAAGALAKYGPGSEKLNSAQLELLEFEPGVSGNEVEAESKREPIAPPVPRKKRKQHPCRQTLPAELPRVERVLPSAAEQCTCRSCGGETVVIGYEQSEQLVSCLR